MFGKPVAPSHTKVESQSIKGVSSFCKPRPKLAFSVLESHWKREKHIFRSLHVVCGSTLRTRFQKCTIVCLELCLYFMSIYLDKISEAHLTWISMSHQKPLVLAFASSKHRTWNTPLIMYFQRHTMMMRNLLLVLL